MAETIKIKKGLDLPLIGAPQAEVTEVAFPQQVTVYPQDFSPIKPRLEVAEGDTVKRGSVLFHDKKNEALKFRSPAAGRVAKIVLGKRRALEQIIIDVEGDESESFSTHTLDAISGLSREDVLAHLQDTGFLSLIRQRPFSRMADPGATPKSIFVNGMNTGSFRPDIHVIIQGQEAAFQAGLNILGRLTEGDVHLCLNAKPANPSKAVLEAKNVKVHTFSGPSPAGNTSVHIHNIDPISPNDIVWTAQAADVIQIGRLFLEGATPGTKVISIAGPGVKEAARKYYKVNVGAPLSSVLNGQLDSDEPRVISGDALCGKAIGIDSGVPFFGSGITVLHEGRERFFMSWAGPGLGRFSVQRTFLSRWLTPGKSWPLTTSQNGSKRAMVLTGVYDKYMPMRIMTDFLVRAVIANDTDEAIKLGILETEPEDFALCAFACPSKTDIVGIIRNGLEAIERKGSSFMKFLLNLFEKPKHLFEPGGKLEKLYPLYEANDTFMFTPADVAEGAPHVRDGADMKRTMITVVLALLPCILFGIWNAGHQFNLANGVAEATMMTDILKGLCIVMPIILVSYAVGGFWEVLFATIRKHEINEGFLVTGILFPLTLPPTIPLWQVAVGISFGVVIGKEIFGGTGFNVLNPALTGRAFLYFAYPAYMAGDKVWTVVENGVAGFSGATVLGVGASTPKGAEVMTILQDAGFTLRELIIGNIGGSIGETSLIACGIGAAILILTGVGAWRIIVSGVIGLAAGWLLISTLGNSEAYTGFTQLPFTWHLAAGGFAFGIVFMATDPVSSAASNAGKWIYGFMIGLLTVLIRIANPPILKARC